MLIGFLWIAIGLAIALASGMPNSDLSGLSRDVVMATWHLSLTGVLGLLLAAEGCRMFQFGWFAWRNR
jgi:hypothetical protein